MQVQLLNNTPSFASLDEDGVAIIPGTPTVNYDGKTYTAAKSGQKMLKVSAGGSDHRYVYEASAAGSKGIEIDVAKETYYVIASALNLREYPMTTAPVVGKLAHGTKIDDAQLVKGMTWAWSNKAGGFFATANGSATYVSKKPPAASGGGKSPPPAGKEPAPGAESAASGSSLLPWAIAAAVAAKIAFF